MIAEHFYAQPEPVNPEIERDDALKAFFGATGADIRHGGVQAYYALQSDHVQMPPLECFRDSESYYATLAHEMTHWTRHPSRLNRDLAASALAMRAMPAKSWGLRSVLPSSVQNWESRPKCARITPPISTAGWPC